MDPSPAPKISVVVPLCNERENVVALWSELKTALDRTGEPWEAILVDDGSTDGSQALLREAAAADARLRALILARNYGQTAALAAGFEAARADVIVTLDGDLQNDPADIPTLLARIAEGHDVVCGWRRERQDPFLTRVLPSRAANWLISWITGVHLHDYGCTLKAYRREVLMDLHLYGEMHRFLPAIASWGGWRIAEAPVNHRPRQAGRSKYGLGRTLKVLLDLVTVKFLGSYVTKPIYVFGGLGIACFALAFVSLGALVYRKVAGIESMIQSPLLLLSTLLVLLGAQSVFLGLLAEMLVRTYYESQKKHIYRVREVIGPPPPA
mgnify:CR=1 FL=1